jgi:hypothetical protein
MRTGKEGGQCADCGIKSASGLFWHSQQHILHLGASSPVETWDDEPERCDDCEAAAREAEDREFMRRKP